MVYINIVIMKKKNIQVYIMFIYLNIYEKNFFFFFCNNKNFQMF